MANVMRWRYGDTNPVLLAVDSATVIEIGDLVMKHTDNVTPASHIQACFDGNDAASRQAALHDTFVGVAMQASYSGDTDSIRVATSGVFKFDQASATVQVGARIGGDDNAAEDALLNQQVIEVPEYSPELSIGRCAKLATSATSVLVAINSTLMNDGAQPVA